MAKEINDGVKRFEPLENADNSAQFKLYLSQNPTMNRLREFVRKLFEELKKVIYLTLEHNEWLDLDLQCAKYFSQPGRLIGVV